ncbi:MAG: hypothetical protein ACW99H_05875 [Candidatus Thorarchaeota archaeon]|jgi:hypothetical protein
MKKRNYALILGTIGLLLVLTLPTAAAAGATRAEEALLADGKVWDTILTPATFKAPKNSKSVDNLYVFMNLGGQRPVAEAAPYEKDYNGGRWWVQAVDFTANGLAVHDPDGDGIANFELTSDDDVLQHMSLGHLTIAPTETYFVCPLIPA